MDTIEMFEDKMLNFLTGMLGKCEVEYRFDSAIRFSKEIGNSTFVLQICVQDEKYKYVALTNILLIPSMKKKGVSFAIINFLLQICNENGYDLYITEIANELWKDSLIKHGGKIDYDGDIAINSQYWKAPNDSKNLKFVEFEEELILESELEWYSNLKEQCIEEVKNLFTIWNAEIEVKDIDGKVKQIFATKENVTYVVSFQYPYIIKMEELIKNNQLEDYIKENQYIGSLW